MVDKLPTSTGEFTGFFPSTVPCDWNQNHFFPRDWDIYHVNWWVCQISEASTVCNFGEAELWTITLDSVVYLGSSSPFSPFPGWKWEMKVEVGICKESATESNLGSTPPFCGALLKMMFRELLTIGHTHSLHVWYIYVHLPSKINQM